MNPIVTSEWLHAHLNDKDLIILDASPKSNVSGLASEFENKQIPNARYFDLKNDFSKPNCEFPNTIPNTDQFERSARNLGITNSSKIVVYDNLGIYSSPRAWWLFKIFGHKNVSVLEGGLPDWIKQGQSTELIKSNSEILPGDFNVKFNSANIRSYEDIKTNIDSQTELIIDARSEGRFNGTTTEPRKELQSGSIQNSANLPFQEVTISEHFLSKTKLVDVFTKLNPENKSLVFSCGSGLTACIIALAYEIAFNKPFAIYDGSWTEWATKENLLT